jgi:glycine cleavage system H protein
MKSHEWVRDEGDGSVTVGISDHAQSALGDLVFVDVPEVGREVAAGDAVAVVESVKAASDVYSAVSGEVIAVNESLATTPEVINQDPYAAGWIARIRLADPAELGALMSPDDYAAHIADEG